MSQSTGDVINTAVLQNEALSSEGMLERVFGRLFRGLVYAQIWEDPVCDMVALQIGPEDHVVCIASGGCNMMSYLTADPASVTAVDLSPWHVKLNRLKILAAQHLPDHATFYDLFGHANRPGNVETIDTYIGRHFTPEEHLFWNGGGPFRTRKSMFTRGFHRFGALGRFIGLLHVGCGVIGVDFRPLLAAKTIEEQVRFFEDKVSPLYDMWLVRFIARQRASLFGLGIPPAQYDKLASDAGGDVIPVLRERTRKLFCDFPISENYFAWQAASLGYKPDGQGPVPPYLEAAQFDTVQKNAVRASIHNRTLTDLLADAPARSKSVYVLLDAQDWMNDTQLAELWEQITRTAMPGARVLFRTGGKEDILPGRLPDTILSQWAYDGEASQEAFRTDRSAIYGGVHLYRLKA